MRHSTRKVCSSINNLLHQNLYLFVYLLVVHRHFVFETSHLRQAVPSILAISLTLGCHISGLNRG